MVCRWDGGGGGREKGGMSVQSMGATGKDFCLKFLQPFLENIDRRSCNDESWEKSSPKMATLSFGGGSHLGVP